MVWRCHAIAGVLGGFGRWGNGTRVQWKKTEKKEKIISNCSHVPARCIVACELGLST